MSEQVDISNYQSEIVERKSFDDQNKGKPPLNQDDEYVFRLVKFPHGYMKKDEKKNADGSITSVNKTMAICEFEEAQTKNIVTTQFRIDKLNFGDDEKFKSGVVKFFQKLGMPLTENKAPNWKDVFVPGMRFRGRVVVKVTKDKDNNDVTKYYLEVATVRKLLPSDKAREDFGVTAPDAPQTDANAVSLAKAKQIVVGCADKDSAYQRLLDAKVQAEILQAFLAADKAGHIAYPIQ